MVLLWNMVKKGQKKIANTQDQFDGGLILTR